MGFHSSSLSVSLLLGRSLPGARVGNPEVRRALAIAEAGGDAGSRVQGAVLCTRWWLPRAPVSVDRQTKQLQAGRRCGGDSTAMWGVVGVFGSSLLAAPFPAGVPRLASRQAQKLTGADAHPAHAPVSTTMNSVRAIQQLNKRELEAAVNPEGSWHTDYRDTAFIYIGGLAFDLS